LAISWLEPSKFTVSGTDDERRIHRVLLRFESPEKAQRVAAELNAEIPELRVTTLRSPEEFEVRVQPSYVFGLLYAAGFRISMGLLVLLGFILLLLHGNIGVIGSSIVVLILGYLFIPAFFLVRTMLRQYDGVLRFEGKSMAIRTAGSWDSLSAPIEIKVDGPLSVVIRSRGSKRKFLFHSSNDASKAVRLVRERYPSVKETNIERELGSA